MINVHVGAGKNIKNAVLIKNQKRFHYLKICFCLKAPFQEKCLKLFSNEVKNQL